jgi:hypothetical protein
VGASLASKGMSYTTLSASDENNINKEYSDLLNSNPATLGYMSQANTHGYNGSNRTQLHSQAASLGKRLWMSEYGDGDATGLTMAAEILDDMKNMQPVAWIYWQAVDNASGWGFASNPLDGSSNYPYKLNEKYYVMGNFSKFVRPGYQLVGMNDANSLAAYDGVGTVALVTLNNGTSATTVTYALQNFGAGPWTATPYQTSSTQNLDKLASFAVNGTSFSELLPAKSVTTFVLTRSGTPGFTLKPSAATLSVSQGASATDTISVTGQGGFSGSVNLGASGLPTGVTAAFGTNPTSGSSVLTLAASSNATVGKSTVTVKGTSGSLNASTTLALTVTAPCTPTAITPFLQVNGAAWQQTATATVASGATVNLGPQPTGGNWSWTGPSGFTSTARQINAIRLSSGANKYVATYTNSSGCKSTQAFTITE